MVFDYFYDEQIRRYLLQFIRIFSLLKIQSAPDGNGVVTESSVPVRYGDMKRIVAAAMKDNSENTILPANVMTVTIYDLSPAPARRNNPFHVGKIHMDERKFVDGEYTGDMGHQYSIERYMPVPYDLTLNLDVWTLNTTTKLQILEQIMMIFNPSVQIQQNMNLLDWSVFTEVELKDITWSSRNIPEGTEDTRDIATLSFTMPIWINPPAKVKRKKLIEEIVENVYEVGTMPENDLNKYLLDPIKNCFDLTFQLIITPGNHKVKIGTEGVGSTELMLLTQHGNEDETLDWEEFLLQYGEYQEGISTITLKSDDDIEVSDGDVIGTFTYHPTKKNIINFTVDEDTLPETILSGPINKIVNPLKVWPGNDLPAAAIGQRYLLLDSIPQNTGLNPWGNPMGQKNDIIEYNGTNWFISFDSSQESSNQYVKSIETYQHYKFTGSDWIHTYFGEYNPGYWRVSLHGV